MFVAPFVVCQIFFVLDGCAALRASEIPLIDTNEIARVLAEHAQEAADTVEQEDDSANAVPLVDRTLQEYEEADVARTAAEHEVQELQMELESLKDAAQSAENARQAVKQEDWLAHAMQSVDAEIKRKAETESVETAAVDSSPEDIYRIPDTILARQQKSSAKLSSAFWVCIMPVLGHW
eukprot:CAMPEP_0194480976 /NCGR_PEP_ID=MMETSP0253-20130528/3602_1 /TAXON_ID=2966 /ORGANISM="Noctiluca scintillans" /LENGTH=178 /DNA_ID=CAMNT_0039320429 /DNA_START=35 /DNA_END=568 /DNA_ORIENTATION=-